MANINNLNVFTFIKDIYQSLKHIDKCFNDFNNTINLRITKIEDNQQIIIDKLSGLEILINKMNDTNKIGGSLNKNIENELLEKMNKMNKSNSSKLSKHYRVELKPEELTFENILENDYTLADINESLEYSSINNVNNVNDNINDNINLNNYDYINDNIHLEQKFVF